MALFSLFHPLPPEISQLWLAQVPLSDIFKGRQVSKGFRSICDNFISKFLLPEVPLHLTAQRLTETRVYAIEDYRQIYLQAHCATVNAFFKAMNFNELHTQCTTTGEVALYLERFCYEFDKSFNQSTERLPLKRLKDYPLIHKYVEFQLAKWILKTIASQTDFSFTQERRSVGAFKWSVNNELPSVILAHRKIYVIKVELTKCFHLAAKNFEFNIFSRAIQIRDLPTNLASIKLFSCMQYGQLWEVPNHTFLITQPECCELNRIVGHKCQNATALVEQNALIVAICSENAALARHIMLKQTVDLSKILGFCAGKSSRPKPASVEWLDEIILDVLKSKNYRGSKEYIVQSLKGLSLTNSLAFFRAFAEHPSPKNNQPPKKQRRKSGKSD